MLLVLPAAAQSKIDFPPLTGRVVDQANLLDPATEQALTEKLAALEASSTDQLVVVTVNSLQDQEIEDFGYQLGRHWGIGQKENDGGALLIVAPNERKVRIEVGYGLEGYLTDALSSLIIQNQILPAFRDGDFPGGIEAGTDAIIAQLQLPPEEAAKVGWSINTQQLPSKSAMEKLVNSVMIDQLLLPSLEDDESKLDDETQEGDACKTSSLESSLRHPSTSKLNRSLANRMSALGENPLGNDDIRREVLTTIMTTGMKGSHAIAAGAAMSAQKSLQELDRKRAVNLILHGDDPPPAPCRHARLPARHG